MHLKSTESCRRAPKTEITTMIHIDLSGKVILLTGAMGAIAEHMLKRLNAAGSMLILIDLKPAEQARRTLRNWQIPGHLIFTSSYVALVPHTQIPSYASAKAALENFARCMALEYASTGVRVNVVSPGNVAAGSSLKVFEEDPAYREFVLRVSLGKRNSPESIADAFVFLCSPLASEISGQIV